MDFLCHFIDALKKVVLKQKQTNSEIYIFFKMYLCMFFLLEEQGNRLWPTTAVWVVSWFIYSLLMPSNHHFPSTAGCTFDEDSDPGLCEYKQGQEDDFDWQLMRTYNWPHSTPDLLRGKSQHGSNVVYNPRSSSSSNEHHFWCTFQQRVPKTLSHCPNANFTELLFWA